MSDDDDYTQVFGIGSDLNGPPLLIGFVAVAAYLVIFSGFLDKLEDLTAGTSYHLVLQRIYREIMMVGFGSFAFTILNQTKATIPLGLGPAFGFADICCFAMSSFFCLQGVFIMLLSVKQAQNWNVASQIPAEELLHNMSVWELSHPLAWRARFLPFCPTREQVEFRIFKSIFATAYNIKASHREFDFSIFLRMSHENNIVKIIDITYKNWLYIFLITGLHALIKYVHDTSCTSDECMMKENVNLFILLGVFSCTLSVFAWLWGRHLELRLVASAGVERMDDYSIFLMTEYRTEETLADVATSAGSAKDIIASYLKQKEISEVESKEVQYLRRHTMFRRVTEDMRGENTFDRISALHQQQQQQKHEPIGSRLVKKYECQGAGVLMEEEEGEEEGDSSGRIICDDSRKELPCGLGGLGRGSTMTESFTSSERVTNEPQTRVWAEEVDDKSAPTRGKRSRSSGAVHPESPDSAARVEAIADTTTSNTWSSCTNTNTNTASEATSSSSALKRLASEEENQLQHRGSSLIVTRKRHTLLRLGSAEHSKAILNKTVQGVNDTKRMLSRQVSAGWRASVEALFVRSASRNFELSADERGQRFANIIKSNFGKQNFKHIFLFKRPWLFYGLISFVMTCNSLYLAWWATNYMFVIFAMAGDLPRLWYTLMTLLPAVVTFPPLFLAIRSSTIVQAITLLDLEVVAKVIEQSQVNTTMLADFRKTILGFMRKDGPGSEGMAKCCNRFANTGANVLTKAEFRQMLMSNKVIYTPEKINFLFGSIDLNGGSTVDFGEFESFLFADDNYESDQKRQELFHKMTIHKVKKMTAGSKDGENNAAYRILRGLNFDTFKEKQFLSNE